MGVMFVVGYGGAGEQVRACLCDCVGFFGVCLVLVIVFDFDCVQVGVG